MRAAQELRRARIARHMRNCFPFSLRNRFYGWYVIVIVLVASAQTTEHPRFSETNLKGSMVLLEMISGTTLAFVASILVLTPFTLAAFLPIQSSMVALPRATVAFLAVPSQPTVPPSASMIARIGTRVLPFLMTGGESRVVEAPLMVNLEFPIRRTMTVCFFASYRKTLPSVPAYRVAGVRGSMVTH